MSLKSKIANISLAFCTSNTYSKESKLDIATQRALLTLSEYTPAAPAAYELVKEYEKALQIIETPSMWPKVSRRSLRSFAWMLFVAPEPYKKGLLEYSNFWGAYSKELFIRDYSRGWLTIFHIIMLGYPSKENGFQDVLSSLNDAFKYGHNHRLKAAWERCEKYHFLEFNGVNLFSQQLSYGQNLSHLLYNAGLTGELATGNFAQLSYSVYLSKSMSYFIAAKSQNLIARNIISSSLSEEGSLRFPRYKAELVEALLLPFENLIVDGNTKGMIRDFILKHYNDPRIDASLWVGVSEPARNIFLSWMVERTLEDFFALLDYVSRGDETADKHWRYRKAFWNAYLNIGVIDEAWLVLGPVAKSYSKQFLSGKTSYGSFSQGSGINNRHSALILRIGNLVITEWSHSGSYRVWIEGNHSAPSFYHSGYTRHMLIQMPDLEAAHHGSESGGWQGRLSSAIESYTGISLKHSNYMRIN